MKFEFKLQSLILTTVITTIVITVAGLTWLVYSRLYDSILDGFDRKLSAISTVTASFVDARTHERVLAPRRIEALTYDPEEGILYGADSSFGAATLVRIDLEGEQVGGAVALASLERIPLSLAPSDRPGKVFGLVADDEGNPSLVEVDLADGTATERMPLPPGSRAISYDADSRSLVVGGNGLHRITLGSETTEAVPIPGTETVAIDELCHLDSNTVIGFELLTLSFFTIDLATGEQGLGLTIRDQNKGEGLGQTPPLGLAFLPGESSDDARVLVAAERLRSLDPGSLAWSDLGEDGAASSVFGFRSESAPIYRSFVGPMERIHETKALTFLYTQTLSDSPEVTYRETQRDRMDLTLTDRIVYVLNVQTEENHSPIGTVDTNRANEAIRDVYFKGRLYLSPIEVWEMWGPVKSGFAPLFEEDGRVVAMAGADVAVGKIQEKTKIALLVVVLTGIGAILGGSLVSFWVARKLTEPIEGLKEIALRIAAGRFGEEIEAPKLVELSKLAESFNTMSRTLKSTVSGLRETNREWETDQQYQELVRHLTLRNADLDRHHAWIEMLDGEDPHYRPSGWTNRESLAWGWMIPDQGDREANLTFRTHLATFLFHLIREGRPSDEIIEDSLDHFLRATSGITLFLIDLDSGDCRFYRKEAPVAWSWDEAADVSECRPIDGNRCTLEPGRQYVLCQDSSMSDELDLWMRCRAADDLIDSLKIQMASYRSESALSGTEHPAGIAIRIETERRVAE